MEQYRRDDLVFDVTDAGPTDGELIVLLHGFPETRASWEAVIPRLTAAGYRALAPDQRGYSPGARPKGRRAYRIDKLAGDVLALADAADAEKFHVVGHDWGGAVAWALAALHPERLRTVTSLTTPHPKAMLRSMLTSSQGFKSWYFLLFQLPTVPEMAFGSQQKSFRQQLAKSGLSTESIDRYMKVLAEPGAGTAAINWYRAVPFAPRAASARTTVPTLYLYGTADFALGRKAADLTANYVDAAFQYEVLDGVSHWIPEEVPETVARLMIDHARAHGPAPA